MLMLQLICERVLLSTSVLGPNYFYRKMGQTISRTDEVLAKLLEENRAQAELRADLGRTTNCVDVGLTLECNCSVSEFDGFDRKYI